MNLNDVHNRKISWTSVLYAVLQIAALTALGVSSCTLLMNY